MLSHFLKIDEAIFWQNDTEVTYSSHYGNGYNKQIRVTLTGVWKVYSHKECIYTGTIEEAVNTYNSIMPQKQTT